MLDAILAGVRNAIPLEDICGIYFKGSAQKQWESILDYVPEISDVDVHILFRKNEYQKKYLGTPEQTLDLQEHIEHIFYDKITEPLHVPRPQILVLNEFMKDRDFVYSPVSAMTVLFGSELPPNPPDKLARIRAIDCEHLLQERKFLENYSMHIIDRPAKYLWQGLRSMVWHISPIGSRVLSLTGLRYETAWSMNRTRSVRTLREIGQCQLANEYAQFYIHCWKYFLSHYIDTNAGRDAIRAGIATLRLGVGFAERHQATNTLC